MLRGTGNQEGKAKGQRTKSGLRIWAGYRRAIARI